MTLIPITPKVITTSKIEKETIIEWFKFYNGKKKYMEAFCRKYATDGSVMEQKTVTLEGEDFIKFYNEEYITQEDLENKIKELAGYEGTFKSEDLT